MNNSGAAPAVRQSTDWPEMRLWLGTDRKIELAVIVTVTVSPAESETTTLAVPGAPEAVNPAVLHRPTRIYLIRSHPSGRHEGHGAVPATAEAGDTLNAAYVTAAFRNVLLRVRHAHDDAARRSGRKAPVVPSRVPEPG